MKTLSIIIFFATSLSWHSVTSNSATHQISACSQKETGHIIRQKVRTIYSNEIGVKEQTGNNDGKRIEQYLHYARLPKGQPWCAAFTCWVYGLAGIPNPRAGWSPAMFPEKQVVWQRNRMISNKSTARLRCPQPGDIFGLYFPEKKRIAHVGFVDHWGEKYVITVEGNTNNGGSRDGDGVYRKRRLISSVFQVADWISKS